MFWLRAVLPGVAAALVTMALTPLVARLAWRLEAVDVPGGRKQHGGSTPRLGGIAIVGAIAICLGPSIMLLTERTFRSLSAVEIFWFTGATLIVFVLGVVDDCRGLGPFFKLFFQVVAAVMVVGIGWQFDALRLPWEGSLAVGAAAAPILSILWIVGVTNAINFIDGLDGLAAGIVSIIAISLLILAALQRNPETLVAMSCIAGAAIGFLRHNWRPAKIYMGDSGSLTLGFILATISLRSSVKASAAVAILVPILALGLPVFDTLLVMWYRFLRGHQRMNRMARMFHADRTHLHHLLFDNQSERSRVMWTLYGLAVGGCVMALLVAASGNPWLGVGFLIVEFGAILLIRQAGFRAEARRLSEERFEEADDEDESDSTAALTTGSAPPTLPTEAATLTRAD